MKARKRKSLKSILLTEIIALVALMIFVITSINIEMQAKKLKGLAESLLARESVSYASEVNNWWSKIEQRVKQTADVYKNTPELSYEDARKMLLKLTELDPDSQDIYIAYGDSGKFLDGSGWIPDASYVFTDRAWYQGAIEKKGELFTSEPYVDASTGKTCLACSIMLRDKVVLSSDVNFDKVAEKIDSFQSSAEGVKYFIIDKNTKDILVSSDPEVLGQKITQSENALIKGLAEVFDTMNTANTIAEDKVEIVKTSEGRIMFTSTDIEKTSWVVVSAVPYSYVIENMLNSLYVFTTLISAGLLVVLAAVLYFIINKYVNPVSKVTGGLMYISKGNFTVKLTPEGNNEITTLSEGMNDYIKSMRSMLMGLANISKDMSKSAGECYDISHALLVSNQTQGESIEKLNDTLSEMNRSVEEVARAASDMEQTSKQLTEHADSVKELCLDTMESSKGGREEMANMTRNVSALNDTMIELTGIIRAAAKSVEEITGITDTINSISAQTNMLSLNASIEAARAGEQGRGFAVVAAEVGSLATQSADATETIRKLIHDVTENIADINEKADICMKDMEVCLTGVKGANKSFDTIYADVTKATDGIIEIAGGVEKINDVATGNAVISQRQVATISEIMGLGDLILTESNKILSETDSISSISESLNQSSDSIKADLAKYVL